MTDQAIAAAIRDGLRAELARIWRDIGEHYAECYRPGSNLARAVECYDRTEAELLRLNSTSAMDAVVKATREKQAALESWTGVLPR